MDPFLMAAQFAIMLMGVKSNIMFIVLLVISVVQVLHYPN